MITGPHPGAVVLGGLAAVVVVMTVLMLVLQMLSWVVGRWFPSREQVP